MQSILDIERICHHCVVTHSRFIYSSVFSAHAEYGETNKMQIFRLLKCDVVCSRCILWYHLIIVIKIDVGASARREC